MIRKAGPLVLAAALVTSAARADDPIVTAAGDDPKDGSHVLVTAYADTAYSYLTGAGRFTSGVPDRVFDVDHDSLALHQAAVNIAYQPQEGFGGLLNVIAGNDADVIKAYNGTLSSSKLDLTQAFVQYVAHDLTVIGGKFVTLAGVEVIASPADTNFSRSLLFGYAEPFTHTGIRASYAQTDALTLYLGVNNGWDDVKDTNSGKTVEFGASLSPSKTLNFAAYGYFGEERVAGLVDQGPEGARTLIDLQALWNVTDSLSLVANYDWWRQDDTSSPRGSGADANWSGVAGYVNYTFNERWKSSFRLECLDDPDGYRTGIAQTWHESTATLAYLVSKQIELRAELRSDGSNAKSFQSADGERRKDQQSMAFQCLFKY